MNIDRATGATAILTIAALTTGKLFKTLSTNKAIANAVVTAALIPRLQYEGYFNSSTAEASQEVTEATKTILDLVKQWNESDGVDAALALVQGLDETKKQSLSKAAQTWAEGVWDSTILPIDPTDKNTFLNMHR